MFGHLKFYFSNIMKNCCKTNDPDSEVHFGLAINDQPVPVKDDPVRNWLNFTFE